MAVKTRSVFQQAIQSKHILVVCCRKQTQHELPCCVSSCHLHDSLHRFSFFSLDYKLLKVQKALSSQRLFLNVWLVGCLVLRI
ncbi:hypothetical protein EB796_020513 [Bugula neritina]|uniref:Uncharacterized protein n=1 Tax=Bugula neritina TaxID=10212 RepID=A0A7J7J5N5_BUGNE|nr:hypothetical protein EB796_020513 [Bugula neritina]